MLVEQPRGNYRFLPGSPSLPFCGAVVAEPGYEIVRAQFDRPPPWREGFRLVEQHLAGLGRPRSALCSVELRCARPYTPEGFAAFNVGYAELLGEWGLLVDGRSGTTRTNVAPELAAPAEQVMFAFAYTVPAADAPTTFVLAGATERPDLRPGEASPAALAEKTADVVASLSARLAALDQGWPAVGEVAVYTAHDALAAVRAELLPRLGPAAVHGLRWFASRPPIVGLEVEVDARAVARELRLGRG
jgi:hypothetical protein